MCDRINTFNVNLSCIILYLSQIKPRSKVFIIYVEREGLKKYKYGKPKRSNKSCFSCLANLPV